MTDRVCEQCGKTFTAKRRNARFCSDACRVAWHRSRQYRTPAAELASGASQGAIVRIPDPRGTLDRLLTRYGRAQTRPRPDYRWVREDEVTWSLRDGRRVVAHAINRGHWAGDGVASWHALCGGIDVSPGDIEAYGVSGDASLSDAKLVAEALASGDLSPLVMAAHQREDVTDEMVLNLTALADLVDKARGG